MKNQERLTVVKYGSTSVSNEKGMDYNRLERYAAQLATLACKEQSGLVVVSSGSVAVGQAVWQKQRGTEIQPSDRALAMQGSGLAFTAWQQAFQRQKLMAGQLLITHREIDDAVEGQRMLDAIQENIDTGIVTVINENDALSDEELRLLSYGGDNDGLASHVARALNASKLMLMTDKLGLLDRDEQPVAQVTSVNEDWARSLAGEGRKGGMRSKVAAALEANYQGIDAHIASAYDSDLRAVSVGQEGTHFAARTTA